MAKKIYGIIGYPVKHSLSPAMHNAAFRELGIDAEYKRFEVEPENLEDLLLKKLFTDAFIKDTEGNDIATKDIFGLNITIPHKVRAREILERKSPYNKKVGLPLYLHYVKISGAINTIYRIGNEFQYRNTDVEGFLKSLEEDLKFDKQKKKIILLGCGGAGRAIVAALSLIGSGQPDVSKIYINDVEKEKFESLKRDMSRISDIYKIFAEEKMQFIKNEEIPNIITDCDLLINATPIGMKDGDPSVIDKKLLKNKKGLSVYDVVYNRKTQLVKDAEELGLNAINGEGMFLRQGLIAFDLWTGKMPKDIMQKALSEALRK